MSLLSNM